MRTLPVAIAGIVTALGYNLLNDNVNTVPLILCLTFALLCQIASNYANEYFDYKAGRDRQGREGPRRGVTEGDISPRAMKNAIFVTIAIACCVGLSLIAWGGWWLIAVGVAVVAGVFAYSTGPYPLSTHGWGEVAVIIFFGIVPVCLTYYVETLQWSWQLFRGGVAIGLLGANVLIVNNYRDVEDDIAVGKKTLAVRFGRPAMIALYIVNALLAIFLMMPDWYDTGTRKWLAVPLITAICAIGIAINMRRKQGAALTPLLGKTAMLMCLYAVAFAIFCALHNIYMRNVIY